MADQQEGWPGRGAGQGEAGNGRSDAPRASDTGGAEPSDAPSEADDHDGPDDTGP
jgi:hypothetical protein